MRRIRILRVLLPAALLFFVVLLVLTVRPRMQVHLDSDAGEGEVEQGGTDINITQLDEDMEPTLELSADVVEQRPGQRIHAKGISKYKVYRRDRGPLVLSAEMGDVVGPAGKRQMHFDDGVSLVDPEAGLKLDLPFLDVDESAGEARSKGEIRVAGPSRRGRAKSLVYGLAGQPTELIDLELEDSKGAILNAGRGLLLDGIDDIELDRGVRVTRGEEHFQAGRVRLIRGPAESLREVLASGDVSGSWRLESLGPLSFGADVLQAEWDERGEPGRVVLRGAARLGQGDRSLAAAQIEVVPERQTKQLSWHVVGVGTVYAQGRYAGNPVWLRADRLETRLSRGLGLRSAQAEGRVLFEGPATHGEARRATLTQDGDELEVRLFSGSGRPARIARERMRVSAENIDTDARGSALHAHGKVEASLLPGSGPERLTGLFGEGKAVHFVSRTLESLQGGERLVFSGEVRGWQGNQNLSADRVVVEQSTGTLEATANVTTRIPRDREESSIGEADYVQIGSGRLIYEDAARRAVYESEVRVVLAEGWMEAERLEADLAETSSAIQEIRATGQVRIEFRDPGATGSPRIIEGTADRLRYAPGEQMIWLFGDATPASVRRIGEGGGTSSGRVLRYQVEQGTLEVDSGWQGSGSIKTEGSGNKKP